MNTGRAVVLSLSLLGVARADAPDAGATKSEGAPHVRETITVKRRGGECSQELIRYEETCILGNGGEFTTENGKVSISDYWAHELVDCGAKFTLCGKQMTCQCLKLKPASVKKR